MKVRYTTETGYPDKNDMVVIDSITFDAEAVTVDNIYNMPIEAVKGLIGAWIIQVLDEFDNEPTIDNEEFGWFWEDVENKNPAHLNAEMAELEDYITVDMIIDIKDNTLSMKLETWG